MNFFTKSLLINISVVISIYFNSVLLWFGAVVHISSPFYDLLYLKCSFCIMKPIIYFNTISYDDIAIKKKVHFISPFKGIYAI